MGRQRKLAEELSEVESSAADAEAHASDAMHAAEEARRAARALRKRIEGGEIDDVEHDVDQLETGRRRVADARERVFRVMAHEATTAPLMPMLRDLVGELDSALADLTPAIEEAA